MHVGVDLFDRFNWFYMPGGKHVWHATKWTISMYRHTINTACTQGYISRVMIVRDARAEFDIEFDVWLQRHTRLRSRATAISAVATTPETLTEKQRKEKRKKQFVEYENKFNRKRPRAMTHSQFRISVINSLVKRRLIADQTSGSDPRDCVPVGPAAARGRGSSVAPSGRGSPVATRGPGRPVTVSRPTIPNRATTKRKVDMVTVACGSNREDRKRVRAVPRLVPKLKLHGGRGKKYDIYGDKAMQRFQGGQCIPGLHPLKAIPATCSFKCQVCRALGEHT